jgi:uracil-DNA glycosylase family 4
MSWADDQMCRMGLTRCPGCPSDSPVIPPDGPVDADYVFLGDGPGKEENSRGRCFVGQTGREFNEHYLPLSGLTRDDTRVRMTNARRCFHKYKSGTSQAQAIMLSCANYHLRRELNAHQPKVIIPMGAVACSLIGGLNLEMFNGRPMGRVDWWDNKIDTFPMFHPASGLHDTAAIQQLRFNFIDFGKYIRGQLQTPIDLYEGIEDYRMLTTRNQLYDILSKHHKYSTVTIDTEYEPDLGNKFWCLTFSLEEGTGYMVRDTDGDIIKEYRHWLMDEHLGSVCFHNGMADLPVLEQVGIVISPNRFDDTMVRSYHLQYLPQGLKYLAYRLCGMRMNEYEDVVVPHSVEVMAEYILLLSCDEWPKPESQIVSDGKGGTKNYKPQGLTPKLKRLLTDYNKMPDVGKFKRWNEWSDEEKLPAITRYGPMPSPSIRYVPIDEAIVYSCRDADATFRVRNALVRLKRMIRRIGWN